MIPQVSPSAYFEARRAPVEEAIRRVLASGRFVLGPEVERFEHAFAKYLGIECCVGVGNGTDAITLALKVLGIGAGNEVITAGLTAPATAIAIQRASASIRFVDVDPVTRCVDPAAVAAAVTPRTAAVVVVHLHGHPAPIPEIVEIAGRHGLAVVEDCAQAHGAKIGGRHVGTFGNAAAFSFYPTKNLPAPGDGGAVVTRDAAIGRALRAARQYGWPSNDVRISTGFGMNSRLDEMHAAVLSALLPGLDSGNARRQAIAARYRAGLGGGGCGLPTEREGHVYHQFAIEVAANERDGLRDFLAGEGIGTAIHYRMGLHRHPAFDAAKCELPATDRLADRMISLPVQPEVAEPNLDRIVATLQKHWRAA